MSSYPPPPVDLRKFVIENDLKHVLCSFSGGKDSLVATYLTHELLKGVDVHIEVVFVDTTVGLPDVRKYVEEVSRLYGWKLRILTPSKSFFEVASRQGMPTPRIRWCCKLLKLEPLLNYAASLGAQRVLFTTGLRRSESRRRAKMKGFFYRKYKGIDIFYIDPIIYWSDEDVERFISERELYVNSVYKLLQFSGECFCGAFTKLEHLVKVAKLYPEFIENFRVLEEAWKNGKFKGKSYKVFYAEGMKLSVDELLRIAEESDC
jgi:phosphoadenosine phosphosulfate reductase